MATSCSSASIQAAINSASSGDTILFSGTCDWSTTVTVPGSKGVTLNGQGTTVVSGSGLDITSNGSTPTRLTGITFASTYGNNTNFAIATHGCGGLPGCGGNITAFVRIDHNTFSDAPDQAIFIASDGNGPTLVDHNTFNGGAASEMIHNLGMGASDASGWTDGIIPGSPYQYYVENNTFTYNATGNPAYANGTSAIQSYYGARTVFRYNTCNMCQVDQHGTAGAIWTRWWEIYNNTFNTLVANATQGTYITLRGGSGVAFSNTHVGVDGSSCCGIDLQDEVSGAYPDLYQIGRGMNQHLSPSYFWGNGMGVSSESGNVKLNRDYYVSTTQATSMLRQEIAADTATTTYSYTPFTYPYPLDSNGMPSPSGSTSTGDTTPPTAPTNVTVSAASSSQINVSWAASTDNVGVAGYKIYRNSSQVGTSSATTYSDTSLSASTLYSYTVAAYDAAGNVSAVSASASATTMARTDTQAPSTPTNPAATAVSSSQINLSWTASTDNVGVAGYKIYRNSSQVGTSSATTYSDTGLSASTLYSYTVAAYDAAGNVSAKSAAVSTTTLQSVQGVSGFIPSTRTIDWTHAGIPGGIPSATWPVYATLSPSGGADDSVAIQTAINKAPAGSVIALNPGTYKLHRASTVCYGKTDDYATGVYEAGLCLTDKSVLLRGAGPNQTILQYGDGANIVSMGQTYLSASAVVFIPVTSIASQGATQLTLQSTSGITPNSYVVVSQTNPIDTDGNPLVNTLGYTGSCGGCGHDLTDNVMSQIEEVTEVNGNVIALQRPLYYNYNTSPVVYILPMIENVGLENLRLQSTASSGTALEFKNVNLEACAHCWVHNVESDWAVDKSHIYLSDVYGSEISNNYLYEAYNHDSGADYAVLLEFRNSENLIQNNIIRKARHSTPNSGSSGNVLAYNYELDAYMGEYVNALPETQTHAPHPFMNLWEGNIMPNVEFDFAHGSGSHNTLFRNYVNLTSTDPNTGTPMTSGLIAMNVAYFNNYENVVGNVFGPYGSTCTASVYETSADTPKVNGVIYQVGYYDDGGGSSPNLALSAKVGQTLIRGGNWDCQSNSVIWSSNIPVGALTTGYLQQQTLPNSLYLGAEPAWFSVSGAAWPPIDPIAATKVNKIPAQLCYESGPKTGAAFNPAACYATSGGGGVGTGGTVNPPTNLVTSAH